tara:strand:+ start:12267 stop:13067 length:801 start_codon:yes stop_codon:yes gene_type:complete
MNFFDDTLAKVFNLIENIVSYIENLVGVNFIKGFTRILEQIHSSALLISIVIVLISGLSAYNQFKAVYPQIMYFVLLGPIVLLILSFWAETFHQACQDLIDANKSTISNYTYFRFGGFLVFVMALLTFIYGIISLAQGSFGPMTSYIALGMLLYSIFLLLNCAPLFNPSEVNVLEEKESSSGEDFVTLFGYQFKAMLYLEKIISRILIIAGGICLLVSLFETVPYLPIGLGLLTTGILFPVLIYFVFIVFYFWFALLQSLLRWGRS